MIQIPGFDVSTMNQSTLSNLQRMILQNKQKNSVVYRYESLNALLFELGMRSNIVKEAESLYASQVSFATFLNSRANEQYWSRTNDGGFLQKDSVLASDAINDIFKKGRLYAFECATAMVIILYKATMDTIGKDMFNAYFRNILLYDWNYDSNLRLITVKDRNEAYPGDILYFKNPDYNPKTPQWQGENAIMLADNQYFGHGVGIKTGEEMVIDLNKKRKTDGMTSAFLTDQVVHPNFEYLRKLEKPITATIGSRTYFAGILS